MRHVPRDNAFSSDKSELSNAEKGNYILRNTATKEPYPALSYSCYFSVLAKPPTIKLKKEERGKKKQEGEKWGL